jgi:hypothetical protein
MRPRRGRFSMWLFWSIVSADTFCPSVWGQSTLENSTLSCTRSSLAYGDAVLPACYESKTSTLDSISFYVSAYCKDCATNQENLIAITPLQINIGLQNGPCTQGVSWLLSGGAAVGGNTGSYIYGNLSAQSTIAFARQASSVDCNGIPAQSGDIGSRLDCT